MSDLLFAVLCVIELGSSICIFHSVAHHAVEEPSIVGFVADINARSLRMHHLQVEIFALHLAHHFPPLLAVHLRPLARFWLATGFLVLRFVSRDFLCCWLFHANLLGLNSTWPGPGGETYTISPSGFGP